MADAGAGVACTLVDCKCKYFDDRPIKTGMYFETASQDTLVVLYCLLLVLSGVLGISAVGLWSNLCLSVFLGFKPI